jgi:hypothetical protein
MQIPERSVEASSGFAVARVSLVVLAWSGAYPPSGLCLCSARDSAVGLGFRRLMRVVLPLPR